eukprot:CAMPEP_0177684648 /NCGR_PEP_ID=MMETSP0447-20121125/32549_1 /TAXON_ID=0 /ORGANISM="Stygamoeba regulata, Strain BSH-02190019" /LENGTH=276 /DNA_ID=CAMNT_0019194521 /DNA_START=172 /DNA_END=999 /DNA_ORIENTATION=+
MYTTLLSQLQQWEWPFWALLCRLMQAAWFSSILLFVLQRSFQSVSRSLAFGKTAVLHAAESPASSEEVGQTPTSQSTTSDVRGLRRRPNAIPLETAAPSTSPASPEFAPVGGVIGFFVDRWISCRVMWTTAYAFGFCYHLIITSLVLYLYLGLMNKRTLLLYALVLLQTGRRLFESLTVTRFNTKRRMSLAHVLLSLGFYGCLSTSITSDYLHEYAVGGGLIQLADLSNRALFFCACAFGVASIGQHHAHRILAGLRSASSHENRYRIPHGILFHW